MKPPKPVKNNMEVDDPHETEYEAEKKPSKMQQTGNSVVGLVGLCGIPVFFILAFALLQRIRLK